jgi:hypothetical protein
VPTSAEGDDDGNGVSRELSERFSYGRVDRAQLA